jgi:type I restriction enzyme S subunit
VPLFSGPGVILGRKGQGPLGVEWCKGGYWVIDTAYSLAPLRSDIDLKYAYFLIKYIGLNHLKDGTSNPTLSRDTFGAQALPLPPLSEQRSIAYMLGALDDKIELNRRMNETLEAMARALFKSWFVDFDPVRAKAEGRDVHAPSATCGLFPDSFEESELGKIPKGWKITTLQDVLTELETGGRPKGGVSGYKSGIPSIGAESIVGLGLFDYSKTKYVPHEFFESMNKGHIRSRDVLLYKDGGRPGEFEPHVTLFGDGFPFDVCAINEHVYRLRAMTELGQNFLFFWLSSNLAMEEMRNKGTGVAIPGLNSTQVKSLTTLVPIREVTRAFDALVEPWISRLLASCNESRTLAALRDTLLPKLIFGELRIKDAERMAEAVA